MRKFEMYGVSALLGLTLTMGVTACSSSDPEGTVENVTVPEIKVVNTVSGMVTDMKGDPIEGAVVTMNAQKVTTGSDGLYSFSDVAAGKFTVDAQKEGKVTAIGEAVVADSKTAQNVVVNLTMSNEGKKIELSLTEDKSETSATETLKDNDAAEIPVEVEAPAGALDEEDLDAEITFTPTYSEDTESTTRAFGTRADGDEQIFLIGTDVACSKAGVKLKKPLILSYVIDPSMLMYVQPMKLVEGEWKKVDTGRNLNTGKIAFTVDEFTVYALFCKGSITSTSGTEAIKFTQDTWDNTNGTAALKAGKAEFSYKLGADVTVSKTDKVMAYLAEMIARAAGTGMKTLSGGYNLDVEIPVGGALKVSGTQAVTTYTATAAGKTLTAKSYGNVDITTTSWTVNRNHTGGGSK